MSRRNKAKRTDKNRSVFPFRLLQHWVKPFESGLPCRCGKEAHFSMQSFFDIERWKSLTEACSTDDEATGIVWDEALAGQLKGDYKVSHVHYACRQCIFDIIATAVGDNAATLAMLPMMLLGEMASVVIGVELSSRDDDGLTFAGMAQARNVDELLRQMKGQTIPINLAKAAPYNN
jgi:hypothetical protein